MRYPNAVWRPTTKGGYGSDNAHLQQGLVFHSMEGGLAGAFSRMDIPYNPADPYTQACWTFSVAKDGTVYQHVDTDNIAWTNGSYEANKRFWGVESEGVAGEPLTEPQYQALLALCRWLYPAHGLQFVRQQTAWEHNEMTRYGSAATACPSGRIPWDRLSADFALEDDMALDPETQKYFDERWTGVFDTLGRIEQALGRLEKAAYILVAGALAAGAATGNIPTPW